MLMSETIDVEEYEKIYRYCFYKRNQYGACDRQGVEKISKNKIAADNAEKFITTRKIDSLSKYAELKERMRKLSATIERTLKGSFRTRADSRTGNGTKRKGGRRKFNVNFIVKTRAFLYN